MQEDWIEQLQPSDRAPEIVAGLVPMIKKEIR